jgi:hypothetical protein
MKQSHFDITINAPRERVWNVLWNDKTYRLWTSVFAEGSHAVSDWKEGSKILFLDPKGEGMFSTIEKMIPGELMSFKHLGVLKNGKEVPQDEETKKWSGAMETYTLKDKDGKTELTVDMDMSDDQIDYFKDVFPKGLEKVKSLAENQALSS